MTVTFNKINKTYLRHTARQVEALRDVSFSADNHEFVSIVGPSGCGKTTLLKIVAGLVKADSGNVSYTSKEKPRSALVFQDQGLLPWLTVLENVCLGLELQRVKKNERQAKGRDFLRTIHMVGFEDHYPHELSGGMKQRVALARAFLTNPDILLMDEPFGALDAQSRLIMQEELLGLWNRERKLVLFVTHDIDEAVLLSDRVVVMSHRPGAIKQIITIPLERPRSLETREESKFTEIRWQIWKLLEKDIRADLSL